MLFAFRQSFFFQILKRTSKISGPISLHLACMEILYRIHCYNTLYTVRVYTAIADGIDENYSSV